MLGSVRRPRRLDRLPEQYFMRLLARVQEATARDGEPIVDLGRGNPDVAPPPHVIEALVESAREQTARMHGYAPFSGLPELRRAIADRYARHYGVELDPERAAQLGQAGERRVAVHARRLLPGALDKGLDHVWRRRNVRVAATEIDERLAVAGGRSGDAREQRSEVLLRKELEKVRTRAHAPRC